ncbi:DUF2283 domain-containing protein [Mycobacterium sp.]|uniref:DUF2283 domain-containing protein n=1 Tax=Mycobacterium sp. TaxID=1785 RepID=UPI0033412680
MRITYDTGADAAYIRLTDAALEPGRESLVVETPTSNGELHLDWKDGKLVGIEVLCASTLLHEDLLGAAERLG